MSSRDAEVPGTEATLTGQDVAFNGHKVTSSEKEVSEPSDLIKSTGDSNGNETGQSADKDKPPDRPTKSEDGEPGGAVKLATSSVEQKSEFSGVDNNGKSAEGDNSNTMLKSDNFKPVVEGDDFKSQVVEDDSKPAIKEDSSKLAAEGDDSKPTVEGDNSKPTVEGDDSKPTVKGDDSKPTLERDDSKPTVEGDDSKPTVKGDDSKPAVERDDAKPAVEGDDSKPTVEGDDSKSTMEQDDSKSLVGGDNSRPVVMEDNSKPIQLSSDSVESSKNSDTVVENVGTGNEDKEGAVGEQAIGDAEVKDIGAEPMEAEDTSRPDLSKKVSVEGAGSKVGESEVKQSAVSSQVEQLAGESLARKREGGSKGPPPKRAARDPAREEQMDAEQAVETGDTPVLGLLERPVEIQTGKRNRRKVDRLAENIATPVSTPADKRKLVIPDGLGVKLGDCAAIEEVVNRTKAEELKAFHKILYGVPGKTAPEVKRNIRRFCGWSFALDDAEHKKKVQAVSRVTLAVLKTWCGMLKLAVTGSKDVLVDRLVSYLMKPTAEGRELPPRAEAVGKRKKKDEGGDEEESPEELAASDEDEQPATKKRRTAAKRSPARKAKTPAKSGRARAKKSAVTVDESDDEELPPTDGALRKQIEKILSKADLEVVTMKTVRQQILDMYSNFDLSHKKDFIKATVKEILGA